MTTHSPISGAEAADRLAIRELIDAYAHCPDRRDAASQMALFTKDTHFVAYTDFRDPEPTQDLHGRDALAPVFDALNTYVATMHFNGQSTIKLNGDRATSESYCLAHHLTEAPDGSRTMMVASVSGTRKPSREQEWPPLVLHFRFQSSLRPGDPEAERAAQVIGGEAVFEW